jgi:hypothetical protein
MLLSTGWRPHGEFKVGWRSPLESRRAAITAAVRVRATLRL